MRPEPDPGAARRGAERGPPARRPAPIVREARPDDLPAIAAYLADRLGRGAEHFRRYFEYGWLADKPNLGFLLEEGGRIGGFLGAIYARRPVHGGEQLFCNLTSWHVDDHLRGLSLEMMARCLARPGCTFTTFSPSEKVVAVLRHFRFEVVDSQKLLFAPVSGLTGLLRRPRPRISWGDALPGALTGAERRIFEDHRGYRCGHFLVEWGGERCYLVTVRRGRGARAFADVLHASNPDLLAAAIAWTHVPIGLTHGTVLTGIDRRLLARRPATAVAYRGPRPLLFRSETVQARELDTLYSELVPMYG
jgi:acetoacetyl-CoA synthetase